MKTQFATLLWEWRESGKWTLLQFFGIMLGLPMFLYLSMYWAQWRATGRFGGISELPQVPIYYAMVLVNVFLCGVGLAVISANSRRSFVLPVPSWMLALSKMLPTAVCAAAFYVVSASMLNLTFGVGWPLLGPALFIALTSSATLVFVWIGQRAPWRACLGGIVVAGAFGMWFHARHGAGWGEPAQHVWDMVTLFDGVCVGVALLLTFIAGVVTLQSNRHDDVPSAWLTRPMAWTGRQSARSFRSQESAQFWFEWRVWGYVVALLTVLISLVLPVMFAIDVGRRSGWDWSMQDIHDLLSAQIMFAILGPIWNGLGLGILAGVINASPKDRSLGTFRGTLPVSDRWVAMQLLLAGLKGLLASWVIAIVCAGILAVILQTAFGRGVVPMDWLRMQSAGQMIASLLFALLSGWVALGLALSVGLCGRVWIQMLPVYAIGLVGLYGAGVSPYVSPETTRTVALMFGVGLVYAWVACGYTAALSHGFLRWKDVGKAAAVWLIGTGLVAWATLGDVNGAPMFVIGNLLVTAAIAPWATAPLALAWNRHR